LDTDNGLLWRFVWNDTTTFETDGASGDPRVTDGEFMGSTPATRNPAGTVTVTANSCNDLTFEYDVDYPGLGSGTRQLVRPFSIETQGYACRDRQARQDALP
jgi:hypothetical protein